MNLFRLILSEYSEDKCVNVQLMQDVLETRNSTLYLDFVGRLLHAVCFVDTANAHKYDGNWKTSGVMSSHSERD